AAW
ncbi:hypothetical protein V3C99_012319, partial [Haemonchus contortus]